MIAAFCTPLHVGLSMQSSLLAVATSLNSTVVVCMISTGRMVPRDVWVACYCTCGSCIHVIRTAFGLVFDMLDTLLQCQLESA